MELLIVWRIGTKGAIIHEWEFNIDKSLPTTRIQDVRFPVMTTLSYSEYEAFELRINFLNVLKFLNK